MTPSEQKPSDASKRRSERISFPDQIQIRKPVSLPAHGVDLGPGGIGLLVSQAFPLDTPVELDLYNGRAILLGTVRLSRSTAGGFHVGVQFPEEDPTLIARVQALRDA